MDPARQREIASLGGRAAHEQGVAHEFSPEEARIAGRKGGESVSQNREHMAQIGRKGGESSGGGRSRGGAVRSRAGTGADSNRMTEQIEETSQIVETGRTAESPESTNEDLLVGDGQAYNERE